MNSREDPFGLNLFLFELKLYTTFDKEINQSFLIKGSSISTEGDLVKKCG